MTEEIWKRIPGFYYYEISNKGRIRSEWNWPIYIHNEKGYDIATLRQRRKGKKKSCRFGVSHLVLRTFVGSQPSGHVPNHKNGYKVDNRPENLEWVTPSENAKHACRAGLCGIIKLMQTDIRLIRYLFREGIPAYMIAWKFKVSTATIYDVIHYKTHRF